MVGVGGGAPPTTIIDQASQPSQRLYVSTVFDGGEPPMNVTLPVDPAEDLDRRPAGASSSGRPCGDRRSAPAVAVNIGSPKYTSRSSTAVPAEGHRVD
jgi:hypothetical protein